MVMKKLNQKGFGAAEVIGLILILSIIGFVGWWVYKSDKATKTSLDKSSQTNVVASTSKPTPVADASSKWTRVSSFNNKFSLLIPDGWTINVSQVRDDMFVHDNVQVLTDDLKVIDGTKPTIVKEEILRGCICQFAAMLYVGDRVPYTRTGITTVIGTVSGVKVTRYENHPNKSLPDTAQPGDTEYYYKFESTPEFGINYIQREGLESHLADIEKIVKSVELNL